MSNNINIGLPINPIKLINEGTYKGKIKSIIIKKIKKTNNKGFEDKFIFKINIINENVDLLFFITAKIIKKYGMSTHNSNLYNLLEKTNNLKKIENIQIELENIENRLKFIQKIFINQNVNAIVKNKLHTKYNYNYSIIKKIEIIKKEGIKK